VWLLPLSLTDFIDVLDGDDFDERPVTAREFITSKKYLGLPALSEYQYKIVEASTQIFRLDTLIFLYGEEEGLKRSKQTYNEVIMQLGKWSGVFINPSNDIIFKVFLCIFPLSRCINIS
jgi:hypothetical protein